MHVPEEERKEVRGPIPIDAPAADHQRRAETADRQRPINLVWLGK